MSKKYYLLLGVALAAILVIALVATKPAVQPMATPPQSSAPKDPLKVPLLEHMAKEESLRVGSQVGADLAIIRKGDEIQVSISEALQKKLGPGSLESLGMVDATETMSWNRYLKFLNSLHEMLVARFSNSHDDHHAHGDHDEHE